VLRGHDNVVECVTFVNVPLAFVKDKLTKTEIDNGSNSNIEEEKKQQ